MPPLTLFVVKFGFSLHLADPLSQRREQRFEVKRIQMLEVGLGSNPKSAQGFVYISWSQIFISKMMLVVRIVLDVVSTSLSPNVCFFFFFFTLCPLSSPFYSKTNPFISYCYRNFIAFCVSLVLSLIWFCQSPYPLVLPTFLKLFMPSSATVRRTPMGIFNPSPSSFWS